MCCIEDEVGGTSFGWGKIRIPFQTCWLDLPSTTEWDIKKEVLTVQTFHCTHNQQWSWGGESNRKGKTRRGGGLTAMHVREDGTVKYSDSATRLDRDEHAFSTREVKGDLDKGEFQWHSGGKCDHSGKWGEKNWGGRYKLFWGVCPKGGREIE